VVEPDEDRDDGKVYFGAWVRLESETGEQLVLRIVGPDEFDGKRGFISMDSPVAKAILRREEGDLVKVERPRGTTTFEIVEVSYKPLT
jgi:transcription elongation factor GreB